MESNLMELQRKMTSLRASIFQNEEGEVWMYGSRARGDFHEDSDWDLLVILDNDSDFDSNYDRYAYPFVELGWEYGQAVIPLVYSRKEWEKSSDTFFYYNVINDRIRI